MTNQTEKQPPTTQEAAAPPAAMRTDTVPALNVFSPTLRGISRKLWPTNLTACMECLHAIWMQTGTDLMCYCRVMYRTTWSKAQPTEILACDGTSLGKEEDQSAEG